MYNATEVENVAYRFLTLIEAVKDGFQLTKDSDELLAFLTSIKDITDEIKIDYLAVGLHIASTLTKDFADRRVIGK